VVAPDRPNESSVLGQGREVDYDQNFRDSCSVSLRGFRLGTHEGHEKWVTELRRSEWSILNNTGVRGVLRFHSEGTVRVRTAHLRM
jgi:hypothetical protein